MLSSLISYWQRGRRGHDIIEKQWTFIRSNEDDTRELANVMAVKYKEISPIEFSHSNIISVYSKKGTLAYQKEGLDSGDDDLVKEIKKQIEL